MDGLTDLELIACARTATIETDENFINELLHELLKRMQQRAIKGEEQ